MHGSRLFVVCVSWASRPIVIRTYGVPRVGDLIRSRMGELGPITRATHRPQLEGSFVAGNAVYFHFADGAWRRMSNE